jgi:hypothetical protein
MPQFQRGDYVVFRDPDLAYAGVPLEDCTFVCKVLIADYRTYRLRDMASRRVWDNAPEKYMRLTTPAALMRDIDQDEEPVTWLQRSNAEQGDRELQPAREAAAALESAPTAAARPSTEHAHQPAA